MPSMHTAYVFVKWSSPTLLKLGGRHDMLGGMAISEAARRDLYTGLTEVLGPERAETLMSALPILDFTEVATKGDMVALGVRLDRVEERLDRVDEKVDRLEGRLDRLDAKLDHIGGRLDRLFQTLVAGLFVVIGAMATIAILA